MVSQSTAPTADGSDSSPAQSDDPSGESRRADDPPQTGAIAPTEQAETEAEAENSESRPRLRDLIKRAVQRFRPQPEGDAATRLSDFLETEAQNGDHRSGHERALLENVLRLRDLRVDDVMVPRADILAVDAAASLDDTLEMFREGAHSRLPVYRDALDDPIGVVHLKDLALSCGFGARPNHFSLEDHVRPLLVVPPSMRIQALLQRMRATRRHMALVIDEYGGVDGLVTIEDVIEQIVGQIEDEHDDAEGPLWVEQAPGCFLAEARAEVDEFETAVGVKLLPDDDEEEIDTLGGLVFVLGGRVPERGEVILHPDGHEIEIVDADPRRIKRVRIRLAGDRPRTPAADPQGDAAAAAAAEATLNGAAAPDLDPEVAPDGATVTAGEAEEAAAADERDLLAGSQSELESETRRRERPAHAQPRAAAPGPDDPGARRAGGVSLRG